MYYVKLFVLLILIFAFSCKNPWMMNLREALENIADVLYPADIGNTNVQLAKIPDPDGIPFWLESIRVVDKILFGYQALKIQRLFPNGSGNFSYFLKT
ncbi:MAG: hypothetical protein ABIM43_01000 [candidate division WOR-3 bacterium]